MAVYGVIQDEVWGLVNSDFNTLRHNAYQIVQNKINVGTSGSKVAFLQRDPDTADVWRELDRITIHDPETNVNYLSTLVLGRDFTEGSAYDVAYLDQFSSELT